MLYGSETRCLMENEVSILGQTAVAGTMCDAKLMDKKNTDELMNMLGLKVVGKSGKSKYGVMVRSCFEER